MILKVNNKVTKAYDIRKVDNISGISYLDFVMLEDIPKSNDEIELFVNGQKEFGGYVVKVQKYAEAGNLIEGNVSANDYGYALERKLATVRYNKKTVNEIITDLIDRYSNDFTTNNVNCDIFVKTIVFDKLSLTECLNRLSELTNYNWYVDYDKDIHFFEKHNNPAPFKVKDDNATYLQGTLSLVEDFTQVRNRVLIRGGEIEGNQREEVILADGLREIYPLANKFSDLPVVYLNGVLQSIQVDHLNVIDDYDVLWDFNAKYLRFRTRPKSGDEIVATGKPLYPMIIQAQDSDSISKYGVIEFFKEDKKIKSIEEANQFAIAELEAYADTIFEGNFKTDKVGLRAGQIITIESDKMDVSEDFLIQRVVFTPHSENKSYYDVELATLRTIGIIDFLIRQLRLGSRIIEEKADEMLAIPFFIEEDLAIKETHTIEEGEKITEQIGITEAVQENKTEPIAVYAPYIPTSLLDNKVKGVYNISKYE